MKILRGWGDKSVSKALTSEHEELSLDRQHAGKKSNAVLQSCTYYVVNASGSPGLTGHPINDLRVH